MSALERGLDRLSLVRIVRTRLRQKWCLTPFVLPFVLVLLCFTGCSFGKQTKTLEWKEEIKLLDGRVISVQRSDRYERVSEVPGKSGWALRNSKFKADVRDCGAEPIVWDVRQLLLAFDIVEKKCYFVGKALSSAQSDYPNLKHPYLVSYVVELGQFQRIVLADVPRSVDVNLFVPMQEDIDSDSFSKNTLSLQDKESARVKLLREAGATRVFRSIWTTER